MAKGLHPERGAREHNERRHGLRGAARDGGQDPLAIKLQQCRRAVHGLLRKPRLPVLQVHGESLLVRVLAKAVSRGICTSDKEPEWLCQPFPWNYSLAGLADYRAGIQDLVLQKGHHHVTVGTVGHHASWRFARPRSRSSRLDFPEDHTGLRK